MWWKAKSVVEWDDAVTTKHQAHSGLDAAGDSCVLRMTRAVARRRPRPVGSDTGPVLPVIAKEIAQAFADLTCGVVAHARTQAANEQVDDVFPRRVDALTSHIDR